MDLFDVHAWKKELAARRLVKRGHATLKEIIELNYGEWPLRGLNIVSDEHLNQSVSIQPMRRWFMRVVTEKKPTFMGRVQNFIRGIHSLAATTGRAASSDKREIYINSLMLNFDFLTTGRLLTNRVLAHERRHVHQYDLANANRRADLMGSTVAGNHYIPPIAEQAVDQLIENSLKNMNVVRRYLSKLMTRQAAFLKNKTGLLVKKYYFREGVEIQARLEELLVVGYRRWPHMPTSREELYAAVMDAGVFPPRSMMKKLVKDPQFKDARKRFKTKAFKRMGAPWGFVRAIEQLPSKQAQKEFWEETLPVLYGDILESLGDREGRARVMPDMNHNLPMLLLGKEFGDYCRNAFNPALDERVAHKVSLMNRDYAAGFIEKYFVETQKQEQEKGSAEITEGAKRFILAFVQAPGIRESLAAHKASLSEWLNAQKTIRPDTKIAAQRKVLAT